jgi:type I restriction enzyme M protein
MAKGNNKKQPNDSGLNLEAQLWAAADKMRGHMDASEYKHVVLGLIFLKYISDAFEEKRKQLLFGFSDPKSEWFVKEESQRSEAAEIRDEYLVANVFWLPAEAGWHAINSKAKSPRSAKSSTTPWARSSAKIPPSKAFSPAITPAPASIKSASARFGCLSK